MFSGLKHQFEFGDYLSENLLDQNHPLVKIKNFLDWPALNAIYKTCFQSRTTGNPAKNTNLIIGLLVLKHLYNLSDSRVIEVLHENIYFMLFCSVSPEDIRACRENGKKLIDRTTLVKARGRLGEKGVQKIERLVFSRLKAAGFVNGKVLITDTTVVENDILYPTDISLAKRVIEHAEMICQKVTAKKEMIKSAVIRKANQIMKVYYSTAKKTNELIVGTTKKMHVLAVDIFEKAKSTFAKCKGEVKECLQARYEKLATTGAKIIEQLKVILSGGKVEDRIVSYYEDHARPMPKGKARGTEFGIKLRLDMNGEGFVTNYDTYLGNVGDVTTLEKAVVDHKKMFGREFQECTADRGFYDSALMMKLEKENKIRLVIPHKNDRSQVLKGKDKKLYDKRSAIEAKISEGKRCVRLGRSLYKGYHGDKIWTALSVLGLNLRKLMRVA
jgi:IS5 family transposase